MGLYGAKRVEAPLLRAAIRSRGPCGLGLERLVHALVSPFWSGWPGSMSSGRMPRRIHPTLNGESRAILYCVCDVSLVCEHALDTRRGAAQSE